MGLFVIEAVVGRVAGVFSRRAFRRSRTRCRGCRGSGRALVVWRRFAGLRAIPGFGGLIVQALDGVAYGDDEGGIFLCGCFPDLFVDTGLGFAGAVAQEDEVEVGGLAERLEKPLEGQGA